MVWSPDDTDSWRKQICEKCAVVKICRNQKCRRGDKTVQLQAQLNRMKWNKLERKLS